MGCAEDFGSYSCGPILHEGRILHDNGGLRHHGKP